MLAQAATDRFNILSSDLAFGHVRGDDRQDWHIPDTDLDPARQALLLQAALAQHRVPDALRGLLPSHPQYAALRHALEVTPATETAKINRIRLNMDRWRWLPRDLGERYIIVNVPAYTAALVEDGVTTSRHRAVAGAIKTPTPQLSATGDRRDLQSLVGSAQEHRERSCAASRATCRSRIRAARSCAGASRRGRRTRSARSSS